MLNMLNKKKFLALALLTLPILCAAQQQRAAFGPVESIVLPKSSLTVLGQTFVVTGATQVAVAGKRVPASMALRTLPRDHLIYVEGRDMGDRTVAISIVVTKTPYVQGATTVYALGAVKRVSPEYGFIEVGTLRIDTSSLAPSLSAGLQSGSMVLVSGIQPTTGGLLVGPVQLSVGGSSTQSVGGSGALSVGGSGTLSVGGSGTLSVGGSGKASVGGSGKLSVGGSGKLSVGGSGKLSVGGSGKLSVGGSGKLSVGGSGKASVGGSGKLSVGGSGKLSVGGSGKLSVGGSGKLSVGGSGLRSVGGSGAFTLGTATQSVGGSGFH
jgi:hypothetical protein